MYNNVDLLYGAMNYVHSTVNATEVVSGCAFGADQIGQAWAHEHNIPVKYFVADWDKFGKGAGHERNLKMATYAKYHSGGGALAAFWNGRSPGTRNMIEIASRWGLRVFINGDEFANVNLVLSSIRLERLRKEQQYSLLPATDSGGFLEFGKKYDLGFDEKLSGKAVYVTTLEEKGETHERKKKR